VTLAAAWLRIPHANVERVRETMDCKTHGCTGE
jgi:hypothetical protein